MDVFETLLNLLKINIQKDNPGYHVHRIDSILCILSVCHPEID